MGLNFNNLIGKLAVGSSNAVKAYLGSQAVWTAQPPVFGCTDPGAINYNSAAEIDDGSCCYDNYSNISFVVCTGCETGDFEIFDSCGNYLRTENMISSACILFGCTDPAAINYNSSALCDDGSCLYFNYVYKLLNLIYINNIKNSIYNLDYDIV